MKADSGGTLIYIIISIVLLIISSIGKSKKKPLNPPTTDYGTDDSNPYPTNEQNPNNPTEWPKELEDIFGKMFGQEPPKEEVEEIPQKEEYQTETYTSPYENYDFKNESLEVIEDENQSLEEIKAQENEYFNKASLCKYDNAECEQEFLVAEDFDIEKAVIYSEIINRKYF